MNTIYRGCDIEKTEAGYVIHSRGSYPVVTDTFPTEDAAMDHVDKMRRELLRKENNT